MDSRPTPFDSDAPFGSRRAIVRKNPDNAQEIEMVEATWGTDPRFNAGTSFRFVRAEGQAFPGHRCLIPASEFRMTRGDKQYRVTLDGGNFFYLAGIWEPEMAEWPLCYRIITVAANPEVAHYQDWHGAIIYRRHVMAWLDGTVPNEDLLVTPPARTFIVEEIGTKAVQTALDFAGGA